MHLPQARIDPSEIYIPADFCLANANYYNFELRDLQ
jgi:hypothetical protein